MSVITPNYCPYCGDNLSIETIGQRKYSKYRYLCKNPECPLIELDHKRKYKENSYALIPIFAATAKEATT